jgi:hypothetical protein
MAHEHMEANFDFAQQATSISGPANLFQLWRS